MSNLPRRLDKFLHDTGRFSVARARDAVAGGRVRIAPAGIADDERVVSERLVFEGDIVMVDGERVRPLAHHQHAMLNKPPGVTSTAADPLGNRDLSEYLREMPAGSFPVGRLDRETTGLLLFTTDGDLATAVLEPEHATNKVYWLWLDDCVATDDPRLRALRDGVALGGGIARASRVEVLAESDAGTELRLTLHTGMNRQIRRMCKALGLHLVHLHRTSIGSLSLEDLPMGTWRELHEDEVERLWSVVGGRTRILERQLAALQREARGARARGRPQHRLETWLAEHTR